MEWLIFGSDMSLQALPVEIERIGKRSTDFLFEWNRNKTLRYRSCVRY